MSDLDLFKRDAEFISTLRDGERRRELERDLFERALQAIGNGQVKGLKAQALATIVLGAAPLLREKPT